MSESGERNLSANLVRILGRVLDTIPAQINVKDADLRYIYVNRALYTFYGDQPDEVIGQKAEDIMPGDTAAKITAADREVLGSGEPTGMWETDEVDPRGAMRHWLVGKWPLKDKNGKITNVITISFDITDLHQARLAGQERERLLHRVTSQVPIMLIKSVIHPDGSISIPFIDGRLVDVFGINTQAITEDPGALSGFIHPDDRKEVIEEWRHAIYSGKRHVAAFRALTWEGEERWLSSTATQRIDEDGSRVIDEVVVDITELRQARQLAQENEQQLLSLARNVPGLISRRITQPDGTARITFLSGEFLRHLGLDPEAASENAFEAWRNVHPDDVEGLGRAWKASIEAMVPFEHSFRFVAKDGTVRWYRARARHNRLDNGDIVSDTLAIDITDEKRADLELQRERELFQSVASHLPGLIFRRTRRHDGSTFYDYIEGALLDMLGIDRATLRNDPEVLWRYFQNAEGQTARQVISDSLDWLVPYTVLLSCRPEATGQIMHIEVTGTPRAIEDGVVVDGIAVDVTARVLAESEARAQRFLLQQVIDAVPAAINVKDRHGHIDLANRALADFYGVEPGDLLGEAGVSIEDAPEDDRQTRDWDAEIFGTGEISDAIEHAYIDMHGRRRYWLGRKSPLFNSETGEVERIVTISLDVTDRVVAEERARENAELLRSVAANIPGAVLRWHIDGAGNIGQEFAAGSFVESGLIDGARTSGTLALIWPGLTANDRLNLAKALDAPAGGRGIEMELRMRVADEARWVKLFGSRRSGVAGEAAWDIIVMDATESKRYEEQLRIAQKMDAIGNLTGGIAHDFNNILAVIVANLDLLLDLAPLEKESQEVADAALNAAERGAELTKRLLAFARNQPAEAITFDGDNHIEGFVKFIQRSLGAEITIELRRAGQPPLVTVDPGEFENALMNLVVNARDAMDGRGRIVIESEVVHLGPQDPLPASLAPGGYVVISVTDTGSGMSPEVQRRAFEPLFTTKSKGHGTGYGLPMVYSFAKNAGGLVTLYSEPGHGTTVRLYLPVGSGVEETRAPVDTTSGPTKVPLGTTRILLVDDNAEARTALAHQLRRKGFVVVEAHNASQALAIAEYEDDIDLLITDVIMPGTMNGAELADRMHEDRPGLPILLISGFASGALAKRQMTRGQFEMLGKPFRERELMTVIARLLSASAD